MAILISKYKIKKDNRESNPNCEFYDKPNMYNPYNIITITIEQK